MRWVEHRRHSMRDPGGVHLNAAGLDLARRVGRSTGPFARVATSPVPRAVETALAMGYPSEVVRPELATIGRAVERGLGPIASWGDYGRAVAASPVVAAFARRLATLAADVAAQLPEDRAALLISHGGIVELSAVASLPSMDWSNAGETAGYLDGVRLGFDGQRCVQAQVVRAPRG